MWPLKTHQDLQGRWSQFRMYQAFSSLFLLIFECTMLFGHFVGEFSSVPCFFITFLMRPTKSNEKAWYTRTFTRKVIQKHDTFENRKKQWCKRTIHSKISYATLQPYHTLGMLPLKTHQDLQGRWSKFWVYQTFSSLFLLIFECITRFLCFFCWFSSVSCVVIIFLLIFECIMRFWSVFRMLQNASECFRLHQKASECIRMLQNASECIRMLQNAPECFRMLQNASDCFRKVQNASECLDCFRMLQNASECIRMLQIAPECFRMHQKASECIRMLQNASECIRMLQNASDCFRMLQNASEGFRMH